MSTFTPTLDLELQGVGENVDTWGLPLNSNFEKIDTAFSDVQFYLAGGIGIVPQVTTVSTNNAPAINTAISAAAASGGGRVVIPSGTYTITSPIILKEKVTLVGQGMGATTIFVNDTAGGTDFITNSTDGGTTWPFLTNISLRNFTIAMRGETVHTAGGQAIRILGCEDVHVVGVESRYSRLFGMVLVSCKRVVVTQCKVFRTIGDGIAVWHSAGTLIHNNHLIDCNDDAISCHTDNTVTATPPPGGIIITGNTVEGSQGIKVLGGKFVVVSSNVIRRALSYGIVIQGDYNATPLQGTTPILSVTVAHNTISDVIFRPETNPRNILCNYIAIGNVAMQKGPAASVPGWPTGTGNTITPFYTNPSYGPIPKTGIQYIVNANSTGNYPSPGSSWLSIHGNTCVRTLPSCTAYSDWGYGPLWVGNNGDGTGFYDGPVTDAKFAGTFVQIRPSLSRTTIENNIFDGNVTNCIDFFASTWKNFDVWRLMIRNNRFTGYTNTAIAQGLNGTMDTTYQDMIIDGNEFDADPRFQSTNRGANGTWTNLTSPNDLPGGIFLLTNTQSATVSRNIFRNLCRPIRGVGQFPAGSTGNIVVGNFSVSGSSTSNAGCAVSYPGNQAVMHQFEESNPTSPDYGKRLGPISPTASNAMPTTGRYVPGDFVSNSAVPLPVGGKVLSGWRRLTFGTGNADGTDWVPIYLATV